MKLDKTSAFWQFIDDIALDVDKCKQHTKAGMLHLAILNIESAIASAEAARRELMQARDNDITGGDSKTKTDQTEG